MPNHNVGELLTVWTIRWSLLFAWGTLAWFWWTERRGRRGARLLWTAACLLAILHAGLAVAFVHGGSHQAAFEATRRETYDVLGVDSGSGLYVNYLFLFAWACDAAWWWLRPAMHLDRSPALRVMWYGAFAFIVFFATVVFEQGPTRWLGLAGLISAAWMAWRLWQSGSDGDLLTAKSRNNAEVKK